jgi:ATP-dependent Clp protease protease subunit
MRRNNLLQLLAENRHAFVPMAQRIQREDDSDEATVYLYDPIVGDRWMAEYWGGVCPQDFVPAVRAIQAATIHLRVNCPGGDIIATEAMCQALREQEATVIAHIEGLAASAATTITCACDRVLATPASKFMIHEGWTWAVGNKRELRRVADLLQSCDASMLADYQRRTGNTLEQLTQWVEAETWFSADEAHQAGFIDEVKAAGGGAAAQASADARTWKLSAYARAPQITVPADPPAPPAEPDALSAADRHHQQRRVRMVRLLAPIE